MTSASPASSPLAPAPPPDAPGDGWTFAANPAGHPALPMAGGVLLLAAGAVFLRADIVAMALVPLVWTGFAWLHERVLFALLSREPLQASLHPHGRTAVTGQPVTVTCRLRNRLPLPLGFVRLETRTCAGLSCAGSFSFDIAPHTEISFDMHLVPLRPGSVFFHGFRVQVRAAMGLFAREYVLHLPMALTAQPAGGKDAGRQPRVGMRLETRAEAGTNGEFSHLRAYVPGDPPRAVVPSASLRRRKPVVQLVHPEISREWLFLMDVSPAAFSGLPGFSPFDHAAAVLPPWVHALRQSAAPAAFRAFSQDVSLVLPGSRPVEAVMKLSDLRTRTPSSARLPRLERWARIRNWILWTYGVAPPEELPGAPEAAAAFLARSLRRLPYARGREPDLTSPDPDELMERFCAATGLEMPSRTPDTCGLVEELQRLLRERPAQLVVFSPFEPAPDENGLAGILRHLKRRGFSFLWMFLDIDGMGARPHGRELLELEARIRLAGIYDLLRRYGPIHFYNPATFSRLLPQLLRESANTRLRP